LFLSSGELAAFQVLNPTAAENAMRNIASMNQTLVRLYTRRDEWRAMLDSLRLELDKHDLQEYFRILNDIWPFHVENNRIRTEVRNRNAFLIRLDGTVVFDLDEANNLLNTYATVEDLHHHIQCKQIPNFTGFDEFGDLIAGNGWRRLIIFVTRNRLQLYCDDYGYLVPDNLRENGGFEAPAHYDGEARIVRRRLN
jgi:hypothetical protein